MKKFIITYAIAGGIEIMANSESEAVSMFDAMGQCDLYEDAASAEITDIFEEEVE